jgi:hypothetical protein
MTLLHDEETFEADSGTPRRVASVMTLSQTYESPGPYLMVDASKSLPQ